MGGSSEYSPISNCKRFTLAFTFNSVLKWWHYLYNSKLAHVGHSLLISSASIMTNLTLHIQFYIDFIGHIFIWSRKMKPSLLLLIMNLGDFNIPIQTFLNSLSMTSQISFLNTYFGPHTLNYTINKNNLNDENFYSIILLTQTYHFEVTSPILPFSFFLHDPV